MAKRPALAKEYVIGISEDMFNPSFYPYVRSIYNYEVYWGGRGSGKSKFISQKLVLLLSTTEKRNLICMRKQATDCKNSCFAEIYKVIHEFGFQDIWQIRENPDMRMTNLINHNEIVFTGMDKVENIKSLTFKYGSATDLWYEEVTEETDIASIRTIDNSLRAKGIKCRLIVSFNPVLETHWVKEWMDVDLNGTDCLIHHSTYKDNLFVDREYAAKLERYKFTSPYEYQVACLGMWGTSGQSVFNAEKVYARLKAVNIQQEKNPPLSVEFSFDTDASGNTKLDTFKPFPIDGGDTLIYKQPVASHPYVFAFDTAGGTGGDFYAGQMMDNITSEQVAVYHSKKSPVECIHQIYGLLRMYNDALVAPEINYDGYPLAKLKEWGYTNIYQQVTDVSELADGIEPKLGWRTHVGNRKMMLSAFQAWCINNIDKINDVATLNEMLTFTIQIRKEQGIFWSAEKGAHDDLVMSFAILLQARIQQSCEEIAEIKELKGIWFPEELEMMVESGKLDRQVAKEYTKKHKADFCKLGLPMEKERKGRYARY